MNDNNCPPGKTAGTKQGRAWETPKLTRLRAQEAQGGSNPFVKEGPFGMAS